MRPFELADVRALFVKGVWFGVVVGTLRKPDAEWYQFEETGTHDRTFVRIADVSAVTVRP